MTVNSLFSQLHYRIFSSTSPSNPFQLSFGMYLAILSLIFYGGLSLIFNGGFSSATEYRLDVGGRLNELTPWFVSFGLDTTLIRHEWCGLNWKRVAFYGRYLSPAILRFGGNDADRMIFSPDRLVISTDQSVISTGRSVISPDRSAISSDQSANSPDRSANSTDQSAIPPDRMISSDRSVISDRKKNSNGSCLPLPRTDNFNMTGTDLDRLVYLSSQMNMSLFFDLNVLLRKGKDFDSSNAILLINDAEKHNYTMNFELGNEPNSFLHKFNTSLSAQQLAKDYSRLRQLLDATQKYRSSLLIGPSITQPDKKSKLNYLAKFLHSGGASSISAVTFHHYYFNGRTATIADFLNVSIMNSFETEIRAIRPLIEQYSLPMWLGESASAFGGGAPGLSDRFIASFLWADQLGIAARNGIAVVVRQSLYNAHYALLNEQSKPNPDYWLTLLYKRLMGDQVFSARLLPDDNPLVRVYAHRRSNDHRLTLMLINLDTKPVNIAMEHQKWRQWTLQGVSLLSRHIFINNQPAHRFLRWRQRGGSGGGRRAHSPVTVAPMSIAFLVQQ